MGDCAGAGLPESAPLRSAGLPRPAGLADPASLPRSGCWSGPAPPSRSAPWQALGRAGCRAGVAGCGRRGLPGQQRLVGPAGRLVGVAVERQPAAGQQPERVEPLRAAVVADAQPPAAKQPRDRALCLPTVAAQPLRRLHAAAGDADLDAPAGQVAAAGAGVVGLVGVALVGPPATPTCRGGDHGDVVQQRLEQLLVRRVGRTQQQRQHHPAALACHVPLAAALGPVDRMAPVRSPPTARRLAESTLTLDQSSNPAAPNSSSSTSWRRSNTPACAHSANRRQQVVTLPQPNSPTGSSAHGVEVRAMNTIAAMQARSGTVRGAPPPGGGGSSGWIRSHSASGSRRSGSDCMPPRSQAGLALVTRTSAPYPAPARNHSSRLRECPLKASTPDAVGDPPWSPPPESNRPPLLYESTAPPAELEGRGACRRLRTGALRPTTAAL